MNGVQTNPLCDEVRVITGTEDRINQVLEDMGNGWLHVSTVAAGIVTTGYEPQIMVVVTMRRCRERVG